MNKISKKIVSLVTMAAFALTLVPAAAFASDPASNKDANAQASEFVVTVDGENANGTTIDVNDEANLKVTVKDDDGIATSASLAVRVWATDKAGNITDALNVTGLTPSSDSAIAGSFYGTVENGDSYPVSFNRTGEYTIHVTAQAPYSSGDGVDVLNKLQSLQGECVLTVGQTFTADAINVWEHGAADPVEWNADNVGEIDLVGDNSFVANGTDTFTVDGYAYDGDKRAQNVDVTITSGNPSVLQFTGDAKDGVVTTDENGFFQFTFTMNDNRNVPITISSGDATYTLRILKETTRAYDIDTVQDGGYVLAGNDSHWVNNDSADFSDAVQISIKDNQGDALDIDDLSEEPATYNATADSSLVLDHSKYMRVTDAPKGSTLDAADLQLVENGDTFTLAYVGNDGHATDLIPGEYTVRVSILSGDYTDVTFNVAKFGSVQDIVLDMQATDMSSHRVTTITDEVTLGQAVEVFAKYVDENGIKIPADENIDFGANGVAVQDVNYGWDVNGFTTKADVASNESLIGTTIEVVAFSQKYKANVTETLTVVDSYNAFTLEFDPAEGAVNEDNDVTVKVVKEDGSTAQVNGQLQAYVADQSNKDATVTVEANDRVRNGKGELTVYASEPTTIDIVVAVKDSSNQGLYAATLEYTVGADKINAHHEVTMTIGSSQYVVDKQLFTMDAAPYVDSNWRTMVPIRALAEAFDADVVWDDEARTVTIDYNEQTIVMNVGDSTYTINGEEETMDTEPVIQGDRTYVPVRFAAEAMGFTVTALYNANSSTASVVFQS